MIRQLDSKEVGLKTSSPKIALIFSLLIMAIIGGSIVMHQTTTKPITKIDTVSSKKNIAEDTKNMFLDKGNTILDAAKSQSGNVSNDLMKTGQQVGAAVLGASVKYMENVASESAKTIASAAASMVIKSTVPGIVDQINKLPSAQKEEVKQIICK